MEKEKIKCFGILLVIIIGAGYGYVYYSGNESKQETEVSEPVTSKNDKEYECQIQVINKKVHTYGEC